jgi:hypothetical protein
MSLSLFVMLLAFFIVLNSLSVFEEGKQESVLQSVKQTFEIESAIQQDVGPSMVGDPYQSIRNGATNERINALFQSQIVGVNLKERNRDGTFLLEMPLETFSLALQAVGQQNLLETKSADINTGFFTPTLISLLTSSDQGIPYHMDIFILTPDNPATMMNQAPDILTATRKQLSSWAEMLSAAGLPSKLFSVGVRQGQRDYVQIIFRPYHPFSPIPQSGEKE